MAKQNVTFVERHLEKIVVGVTGAALLAVVVLYLVGTPHSVDVQGEWIGPPQLYAKIRGAADAARDRMKRATPQPTQESGGTSITLPPTDQQSPYLAEKIPTEFPVPFGPLSPPIPEIQMTERGKIRLAEILPPTDIHVSTGMAYAKLPRPVAATSANVTRPDQASAITADVQWAVVAAAISRKEQRAKFDQAQYAVDRQAMMVAAVEAERQERLPDGRWSDPVPVTGYSDTVIPVRRTAQLIPTDSGELIVADQTIAEYRKMLETAQAQADILRPRFQEYLEVPILWQVPAEVNAGKDTVVKLADFGATIEQPADPRGRGPAAPGAPGPAAPAATPQQRLREAEDLIKDEKYLEAEDIMRSLDAAADVPQVLKKRAQELLRQIQPNVDRARLEIARQEKIAAAIQDFGPDAEPLWLTDVSVLPDRCYRYRVRLLAFNPYVGFVQQLQNPEDAGKVVVEGQWSEWSDPVYVRPTTCVFYNSFKEDSGAAKLEVKDWSTGVWQTGIADVRAGDKLTFTQGRLEFNYDNALVAEVVPKMTCPDRTEMRGQIAYRDKPASTVTLIAADGRVEEHCTVVDARRKKDFNRETEEIRKRSEAYLSSKAAPTGVPAGPPGPPGPPGRPGAAPKPGPMDEMFEDELK